jgi:hypothetical protein
MLPLLAAGVLLVGSAHAQTDYRTKATGMLTVGAGFAGGASLTLEPQEGSKIKPGFAWRLTADGTYPLNPTVAAMLSLGLDSRGFRTHAHDDADDYVDTRLSYFSIFPAFKFSAFTLGLNLGIPMSASATTDAGITTDADMDEVNLLVEPRLGVVIPVVDEDIGWLGITLSGGISTSDVINVPQGIEMSNQMVSGHLGLTWQFGIKGTR